MCDRVINNLYASNISFQRNLDLNHYSYAKTGGTLDVLVLPQNIGELKQTIKLLKEQNLQYKIIGETSNILFLDNINYGICINLKNFNEVRYNEDGTQILIGSGANINDLVDFAVQKGIEGFQGLVDIPGTIGGAIYMNAEAFRCQISDNLVSVDIINPEGEVETIAKEDLNFKFRYSAFQEKFLGVIFAARFNVKYGDKMAINEEYIKWKKWRELYLENSYPNLGSIFATKNIYIDIARNNKNYSKLLNFITNRVYKKTKPTNNKLLNFVTAAYFGWMFKGYPYSDKTLNTFANKNTTTDKILDYINEIKRLTNNTVPIENEILEKF